MRIGMMADVYKPYVSGVTGQISLTKGALEALGHEVFVFTFGYLDYEDDEVNVVRCPGLPLSDTGIYFGLRYPKHARRKLQTMDVVHIHHPFVSGRLALRYCQPYNIPVVFTNHTRYDLYRRAYIPIFPEKVANAFLYAYLVSLCRAIDLVIAPSAGLMNVLRGFGVDAPIEVIPNGIDLSAFSRPIEPVPRQAFGFSQDHVLLVYVGRLAPEKNLAFLLRAFGGVHAAYPQARLLLVGDGPERDHLEDQVLESGLQGKVHFAGVVQHAALPAYLAAADLFVTASVSETFCVAAVEAMASGLPVLAIDSPGLGDVITDGSDGVLTSSDIAAYTANLARLVADPNLRAAMSQQARKSAQQYAIERASRLLEEGYERLLRERSRRRVDRWQMAWRRWIDRVS